MHVSRTSKKKYRYNEYSIFLLFFWLIWKRFLLDETIARAYNF